MNRQCEQSQNNFKNKTYQPMRRPKPTEIEQYLYNTVILFIFITNSLPAACYAKDFTSLPQKMIVDQICGTAIVQTTVYIKENHRNTSYEK